MLCVWGRGLNLSARSRGLPSTKPDPHPELVIDTPNYDSWHPKLHDSLPVIAVRWNEIYNTLCICMEVKQNMANSRAVSCQQLLLHLISQLHELSCTNEPIRSAMQTPIRQFAANFQNCIFSHLQMPSSAQCRPQRMPPCPPLPAATTN